MFSTSGPSPSSLAFPARFSQNCPLPHGLRPAQQPSYARDSASRTRSGYDRLRCAPLTMTYLALSRFTPIRNNSGPESVGLGATVLDRYWILDLRMTSDPSGWPPLLSALLVPNQIALTPGIFTTARIRPNVPTKWLVDVPVVVLTLFSSTRQIRWPRRAPM